MGLLTNLLVEAAPLRARRAALSILALLPLASCAIFQGAAMLPDMSEDEATAYGQYLGSQLGSVARSAVESGAMSMGSLMNTALAFEAIGMGTVPPLTSQLFDAGSLGATALQLTINDIHYQLTLKGGFQDGQITANAKLACIEIAMKLKDAYKALQHA